MLYRSVRVDAWYDATRAGLGQFNLDAIDDDGSPIILRVRCTVAENNVRPKALDTDLLTQFLSQQAGAGQTGNQQWKSIRQCYALTFPGIGSVYLALNLVGQKYQLAVDPQMFAEPKIGLR